MPPIFVTGLNPDISARRPRCFGIESQTNYSSRVLLFIVSESGPISVFQTFIFALVLIQISQASFIHDSNHFQTFQSQRRRKIILFEVFPSPKSFNFQKLKIDLFSDAYFFFLTFSELFIHFKEWKYYLKLFKNIIFRRP